MVPNYWLLVTIQPTTTAAADDAANTTDNAIKKLSFANNSQGVGGLQFRIGGQFKTGTLPSPGGSSSTLWAPWQKSYGNHPYGGGIGFFKQANAKDIFTATNIPIYATMGWANKSGTVWSGINTGNDISTNFTNNITNSTQKK